VLRRKHYLDHRGYAAACMFLSKRPKHSLLYFLSIFPAIALAFFINPKFDLSNYAKHDKGQNGAKQRQT